MNKLQEERAKYINNLELKLRQDILKQKIDAAKRENQQQLLSMATTIISEQARLNAIALFRGIL